MFPLKQKKTEKVRKSAREYKKKLRYLHTQREEKKGYRNKESKVKKERVNNLYSTTN